MAIPSDPQEPRGFPCPACREPIRVPLSRLVGLQPIYCSSCGLKLEIAPDPSRSAIDAARRLSEALAKVPKH